MSRGQRLVGVDLWRGIAAYAVVVRHSGDSTWAPVSDGVLEFRAFFDFAVPFFLATSFYLAAQKLQNTGSLYSLGSRFQRLLMPYLFWSLIYVCFKATNFLLNNDITALHTFLDDPIAIVFLGSSSVQLYFLPLLFVGTCWMMFTKRFLIQEFKIRTLAIFFLLSVSVYQILASSGNSYNLSSGTAFMKAVEMLNIDQNNYFLIRLILVVLAWIIRCFPYIFMAIIVNRLLADKEIYSRLLKRSHKVLIFCLFLVVNSIGYLFIPTAFREIIIAFSLLIFSILVSDELTKNVFFQDLSSNLGACSFGIYLVHVVFIQALESLLTKSFPGIMAQVTIPSILVFSILNFLVSWIVVRDLLLRNKFLRLTIGS